MKKLLCLLYILFATTACTYAQETVEEAANNKIRFEAAVNNIDHYLVRKDEEKAQATFNEAAGYIELHIKTLEVKLAKANTEAQKIMFTEKITAAQKQLDGLKELSKKMPENRTVINLKMKEVLAAM